MEPFEKLKIDKFIYLDACPSTNAYVINESPLTDQNTVVYTFDQTAGKGQIGRTWHTGSGKNLALSFSLHPVDLDVAQQWKLSMAISLVLINWVRRHLDGKVLIKWPNDIYVNNQKLMGILIQNILRGSTIQQTVIGIGINVNEDNFPDDLPNPVSMSQLTKNRYDLIELVQGLTQMMNGEFNTLMRHDETVLKELYEEEMYLRKVPARFDMGGVVREGIIQGVTAEGKLVLEVNGEKRVFDFRELRYVLS